MRRMKFGLYDLIVWCCLLLRLICDDHISDTKICVVVIWDYIIDPISDTKICVVVIRDYIIEHISDAKIIRVVNREKKGLKKPLLYMTLEFIELVNI